MSAAFDVALALDFEFPKYAAKITTNTNCGGHKCPPYTTMNEADAEKSDLFNVLAYALPTLTRRERAARAKVAISKRFNTKQQSFLNFVLAHYEGEGVQELDHEKLTPLLHLTYFNSTSDAIADLGEPEEIRKVFVGFQNYLYQLTA